MHAQLVGMRPAGWAPARPLPQNSATDSRDSQPAGALCTGQSAQAESDRIAACMQQPQTARASFADWASSPAERPQRERAPSHAASCATATRGQQGLLPENHPFLRDAPLPQSSAHPPLSFSPLARGLSVEGDPAATTHARLLNPEKQPFFRDAPLPQSSVHPPLSFSPLARGLSLAGDPAATTHAPAHSAGLLIPEKQPFFRDAPLPRSSAHPPLSFSPLARGLSLEGDAAAPGQARPAVRAHSAGLQTRMRSAPLSTPAAARPEQASPARGAAAVLTALLAGEPCSGPAPPEGLRTAALLQLNAVNRGSAGAEQQRRRAPLVSDDWLVRAPLQHLNTAAVASRDFCGVPGPHAPPLGLHAPPLDVLREGAYGALRRTEMAKPASGDYAARLDTILSVMESLRGRYGASMQAAL